MSMQGTWKDARRIGATEARVHAVLTVLRVRGIVVSDERREAAPLAPRLPRSVGSPMVRTTRLQRPLTNTTSAHLQDRRPQDKPRSKPQTASLPAHGAHRIISVALPPSSAPRSAS
jgi:hypothetical protein